MHNWTPPPQKSWAISFWRFAYQFCKIIQNASFECEILESNCLSDALTFKMLVENESWDRNFSNTLYLSSQKYRFTKLEAVLCSVMSRTARPKFENFQSSLYRRMEFVKGHFRFLIALKSCIWPSMIAWVWFFCRISVIKAKYIEVECERMMEY